MLKSSENNLDKVRNYKFCDKVKKALKRVRKWFSKIFLKSRYKATQLMINSRKSVFKEFAENYVEASKNVYNSKNIVDANKEYDIFITGSDQVWSAFSMDEGYSLSFVFDDKVKIAYAASGIGTTLKTELKNRFTEILPKFNAVSVREKHMVNLLQPMYNKKINHVCDPVLLLSSSEWDEISSNRIVDQKYVFCYFLGGDKKFRKLAIEFAKEHGLKTVFIPFLKGRYCPADYEIGDYRIVDASPSDFISLIKNAEYVFTDSFHACAFSTIYQKQFFAFKRSDIGGIKRIWNVIELSGAHAHLIEKKYRLKIEFLESIPEISYFNINETIEKLRDDSIDFLRNALRN